MKHLQTNYMRDWNNREDMLNGFGINEEVVADAQILLAYYNRQSCEGYVLLRRGHCLYDIHQKHHESFGLGLLGKWKENETTLDDLTERLERKEIGNTGSLYFPITFAIDLTDIITEIRRYNAAKEDQHIQGDF
jgi:hypothetical protein